MEPQLSGISQSLGINECSFNTTNISPIDSPTSTSASIDSHDPFDPSSWDITHSSISHPSERTGILTPRRRPICRAGMISMDGLWLPYSAAEYGHPTKGLTDFIMPEPITPTQFTPIDPVSWYAGCTVTPAANQQTATSPSQDYSLASDSPIYTPMSYLYGEPYHHLRDSQHPLLPAGPFQQPRHAFWKKETLKPNLKLGFRSSITKPLEYKCKKPGCHGRFKRQEHVTRHMKSHLDEKPYVCWVPFCNRAFSRGDNLSAHFKTHSKRSGRNRYVSTLDGTSPDYDPDFRGDLTPDGRPVYEFTLGESVTGHVGLGNGLKDETI